MSRTLKHVSTRLVVGFALVALSGADAYGQGRSMAARPFMTPTMMMPTSSFTGTAAPITTNAMLQRDPRLDPFFMRGLGRNASMGVGGYGNYRSGIMPSVYLSLYGGSPGVSGGGYPPAPTSPDPARADLLREQAAAERLANRRRAFDDQLYERERTPTPEQELLSRSRSNSPPAEVLSGQTLNALLVDLRRLGTGVDELDRPDAVLPLDRKDLRHINVTHGAGNIALLKDKGRLTWPAALAGPVFQEPRDRLAARALDVVRQANRDGRVDPVTVGQMSDDVVRSRALLRRQAGDLSFQQFSEAKSFLQGFDDALIALRQPDAAGQLTGVNDLRAQTVLGLIRQMTENGLRFAPAAPGDEAAYLLLRETLAACDRAAAGRKLAAR